MFLFISCDPGGNGGNGTGLQDESSSDDRLHRYILYDMTSAEGVVEYYDDNYNARSAVDFGISLENDSRGNVYIHRAPGCRFQDLVYT